MPAAKLGFDGDEKGGKETEEARFARIREAVMTDLKHTFRPEFLNRIDEIIVFRQLTQENIVEIARRMLTVTGKRMAQQGITLISDDDAVAELARDGFDPQYGARPLRRAIQNQVEDAVAELCWEGKLKSGDTAHVRLRDGKVVIDSEAVPAEAVSAAEAPAETARYPCGEINKKERPWAIAKGVPFLSYCFFTRREGLQGVKRLLQVGDEVLGVFQTHGQTDQAGGDAGGGQFLLGVGGVRHGGGVLDQRLGVAQRHSHRHQVQGVHQLHAGRHGPPLTSKDSIPPKSRIWRRAMSWPGWSIRPG